MTKDQIARLQELASECEDVALSVDIVKNDECELFIKSPAHAAVVKVKMALSKDIRDQMLASQLLYMEGLEREIAGLINDSSPYQ